MSGENDPLSFLLGDLAFSRSLPAGSLQRAAHAFGTAFSKTVTNVSNVSPYFG
jgi:hypothetical protein